MRSFESLSEREILALAISLEEEDQRIYADFAEGLKQDFPASAGIFEGMREEEATHRRRLFELYRAKFGDHIPLIRRHHIKGFCKRDPMWLTKPLRLEKVRSQAATMELETRRFYEKAASRSSDAPLRELLFDLAQEERSHETRAQELEFTKLPEASKEQEDQDHRRPITKGDVATALPTAAKQLSVIGGVSLWRFYFRLFAGSIRTPQVIEFLKALQATIDQKLLIIWDRLQAHRSKLVNGYVEAQRGAIALDSDERPTGFASNATRQLLGWAEGTSSAA